MKQFTVDKSGYVQIPPITRIEMEKLSSFSNILTFLLSIYKKNLTSNYFVDLHRFMMLTIKNKKILVREYNAV